jgi:hypothetical protein
MRAVFELHLQQEKLLMHAALVVQLLIGQIGESAAKRTSCAPSAS